MSIVNKPAGSNTKKTLGKGLTIERIYTTAGKHPYDEVKWERRDVVQTNWKSGEVIFEQKGVEYPDFWSVNASTIVTTKYFRGAVGHDNREWSLKQVIDRVVLTYTKAGKEHGYFASDEDAQIFEHELTWMLMHQVFSFNSPVWFNVGTNAPQQVSACFILSVDDTMDSILNWYREEGMMVVLDVDHPDIEEFIETKVREEDKIRALRDAGFDMDLGGKDIISVQYQNANNSVRVSDKFMRAYEQGSDFGLVARASGEVIETVEARQLFRKMAEAAWACADPGIQYDDTINAWHTNPETGRINASNPCSEYMSLDNSSCNLASLNLLKFLESNGSFDTKKFVQATELIITAMDISICFADFPTEPIGETTRNYRQLGIGYANLGALLMASGLAYDSDGGRQLAGAITSVLTGVSYRRSAELAGIVGPYAGYARNAEAHTRVMKMHANASTAAKSVSSLDADVWQVANKEWSKGIEIGQKNGWRNAQASVLAPTGTIGLMMDCDTTGIEPDLALVKFKKLVGGGSMQIVNQTIPQALRKLGYTEETNEAIVAYIAENGNIIDAPGLKPEHYDIFDCAMGIRSISAMGHVKMMAACQPFLSGAISKTVNLPSDATVEEIEEVYYQGWKLGLKALAVYRDNCKVGQPLSDGKGAKEEAAGDVHPTATRKRLPKSRPASTTSFQVGGAEGYMTAGAYADGALGEVFLKLGKQGSTLAGVMDAFSIAVSIGLQYGVPLETFVEKFTNLRFEPAGMTDDADIRMAQSIMDYIFRRLALDYLPFDSRSALGLYTASERARALDSGEYTPDLEVAAPKVAAPVVAPAAVNKSASVTIQAKPETSAGVGSSMELFEKMSGVKSDAPLCMTCGVKMRMAGSCFVCEGCGNTSGCS